MAGTKPNGLAERLKDAERGRGIVVAPGVYDALSASIASAAGFDTLYLSGAAIAYCRLGRPDIGLVSSTEVAETIALVRDRVDCALIVDADTGYGNALNVYFTVRGFEDAGLAAVMFEDQVWPKRCGHMAGKAVIPAEEMVQKVKAAVAAKRDPDFVIKARTDAAGPLGIEEAIRRLNMYAEAGADCLFADALLSAKDIERVARNVPPFTLSVNMGLGIRSRPTTPLLSPKQLEEMGVAQVSYPRLLTTAALKGMLNAMDVFTKEVVAQNKVVDRPDLLASFDELNELMGFDRLDELEKLFA